ncbi:MAG: amidohydrolase family protein [Pseudomonadota bacterium]
MHDLIIRGGTVVDGTGADAVVTDIAVTDGKIAAIGDLTANPGDSAKQQIDARGALVTPGFVDLHTHLDAQIGWDPMMTPISWHGVTTALLGNCGVTFAPCKPTDRELLAGMMETVEDIPRDAILNGLPWTWESYGDYLSTLSELKPALNVGGLIGHCALRYYVMGERGVADAATPAEIDAMASLAAEAIRDGAVGFSTSRFLGHYLPDGRHVPGTHAAHEELVAIARAVSAAGGLMQNVLNLGGDFDGELDLLRKQAETGARVLFSTTAGTTFTFGDKLTQRIEAMRAEGLDVNAICIPRGSGFVSGLQCLPLWSGDQWRTLRNVDFETRLAMVNDDLTVAELIAEAERRPSRFPAEDVFYLGSDAEPDYTAGAERSLGFLARAHGESPAATWLRTARDSDGQVLWVLRMFNKNLDAVARLISTDWCLPSLGDAGAHVSQIMDSGWATFTLAHWHRDTGLYDLPEAVRRLTSAPARIMGLDDRGTLAVGRRADLNVIDLAALGERMPRIVHDFPGEAPRFIQQSTGYRATVCNGAVILEDGALTGSRAGQLVNVRSSTSSRQRSDGARAFANS